MSTLDNLGDLFDGSADPEKIGLIDLAEPSAPRECTHGEIDRAARAVARGLVARGHRRGDRIAILSANRAEYLTAYLGTLRAGMVAVPVSFSSVERVGVGSAPLTQALIETVKRIFPGALVTNGYGTTETGPIAFGPGHPRGLRRPDISLGYPVEDIRARLVRDGNRGADEGELELWTPALMQGYHHLPAKTAGVMTEDGYYRTGDVMRRDEHGFYYFVGRADDMFVCGGENIYPGEVERMLERHPEIQEAAVVPVSDEVRGQKPVAFVVAAPSATVTAGMVKDFALAHGPAYAHPRHVELVAELPLAGTGKVDRRLLIERAEALAGGAPAAEQGESR